MEGQQIVEMQLANGAVALARATVVEGTTATKVSALEDFKFDDVVGTLEGVADSIKSALRKSAPTKVSVELGLELAVKSGKLSALLVDGQGKGSIAITLEWDRAALDA